MIKTTLWALFLTIGIGLAEEPTPVTPPAATEDLSTYNSADALWDHITKIDSYIDEHRDLNSLRQAVPKMAAATAAFATQYPADPRVWSAKLLAVEIGSLDIGLPPSLTFADRKQRLNEIINAPSASQMQHAEATAYNIITDLSEFYQNGKASKMESPTFEAVDAGITAFDSAYGSINSFEPDFFFGIYKLQLPIGFLREKELILMREKGDTADYQALLHKLSTDPRMKNLVEQEMDEQKRRETKEKFVTQLKSQPMDLKFTAVDGTSVDIANLRGKVVLIDFWATWCGGCCAEMPKVIAAYQKYHDKGVEVIGISLDQDQGKLIAFTKSKNMVCPQYFDGKGWSNSISQRFYINEIPAIWLIDKKGMLVTTDASADLDAELEKALQTNQ